VTLRAAQALRVALGLLALAGLFAGAGRALGGPPLLDRDQLPPRSIAGPERFARGRILIGDDASGRLALTFDDGPKAETTGAILDELDRRGARATFFVNAYRLAGRSANAERQRALLRRAAAAGHAIGNHTFSHPRLTDLAPAEQAHQIVAGELGIERVLGERPYLFRPPFGRMTEAATELLRRRGYTTVLWDVSSEDPFLRTPERVVRRALDEIRRAGGGVVLFHDTHEWTVRALPRFFDALAAENCRRAAAGETILLVVELDRLFKPRNHAPFFSESPAARRAVEAEGAARHQIALACGAASTRP